MTLMAEKEKKEKKQRRRGKGEGTIYQREDTKDWVAQYKVNGKRKTITGKTRTAVAKKLAKILNEIEEKTYNEPSSETVETFFNNWLELKKPHIEEMTYINYKGYMTRHIIPKLGHIKLKDLTTDDVQIFVNDLIETKSKNGKENLEPGTIRLIYIVLSMGLKKAYKTKKIPFQIADPDLIELPRKKTKTMETLSKKELMQLLKHFDICSNPDGKLLEHQRYIDRVLFASLLLESVSGLRKGELMGLKWDDFDFEKGTININQQWSYTRKFKGLKTDSSYRTITLNSETLDFFKWFKAQQNEIQLLLGESFANNGLVFCYQDGRPVPYTTFTGWWISILKKAKIKHVRFHDMRHTFVTLGLEDGVDFKVLQSMTGHKSIKTFFDVYGHVTEIMQNTAAEKIGKRVSNVIPFKKTAENK